MSGITSHFPAVSAHLCRALDELGMNTLTVKRRREAMLFSEKLLSWKHTWNEKDMAVTVYHFGSQIEGTTTPGMNSDTDTVYCPNIVNVIQDWPDWERRKVNLWMLQEGTAPGYCRLQLLASDIPIAMDFKPHERYISDSCGRIVMKHYGSFFLHPTGKNGPAQTETILNVEFDQVEAYKCSPWPKEAAMWIKKHRDRNWPFKSCLQRANIDGFLLVSVGYKLSETEELEWRISFSLTERRLMFSMNIIQLKCYVILKMIMKSLVIPLAGESISSYHCKTALFYCVEESGSEWWTEDNLLHGIIRCLSLLLSWAINEFCPHFILPESNLFAGKITVRNKRKILSILRELINSDGRFLLLLPIDELGNRLILKVGTPPLSIAVHDSDDTKMAVGQVDVTKISSVVSMKAIMLKECIGLTPMATTKRVLSQIETLCVLTSQADRYERQAIRVYLEFFSCLLGSLLVSLSMFHQREIPRKVFNWFRIGATQDIANKLKHASVLFCCGYFRKAELILSDREMHRLSGQMQIQTLCGCYNGPMRTNDHFCHQMYDREDERSRSRLFADCVRFSPQEFYCVPKALRYEFFRSVGDDYQHRDPLYDKWMDMAVADGLPYLCFLQYLTYTKLGHRLQQVRILRLLEQYVETEIAFSHLETTWNLLGHCMELERKTQSALDCYVASLKIRPMNNAANWHIPILVYKVIKGELPSIETTI